MPTWIRTVPFPEVLAHFEQNHPVQDANTENTNAHARACLEMANERVTGAWALVSLDSADAREIILPHHISEGGTLPLIPPTGMTLGAAADKIREIGEQVYASANPVCWKKLEYWFKRYDMPLFLSVVTVDHSDYQSVVVPSGRLVHLDGLHRLIAWDLSGYLRSNTVRHPVHAYIAGFDMLK